MTYGMIFFTSVALLGYEITFTRVFSFAQWHNLSSVIITMALLGFGASGTAVTLLRRFIVKKYSSVLMALSLFFPLFMVSGFIISTALPLNPYELSFSIKQIFYITIYFLLMCLPFFAGSCVICILFMKNPPSAAYAVNLIGSAAGAAISILFSYHEHPYRIMDVMILISLIPLLIISFTSGKKYFIPAMIAACFIATSSVILSSKQEFRKVSQYKPVSGALNLPGAKIIYEGYSPLSVVQVLEAEGLRTTAGLSLASPHQVPVQRVIFFDGDSPEPVSPFNGDLSSVNYIRYLASWLPYYLKSRANGERVLIIGAGGGEPLLKAIIAGFNKIDAVEINSRVIAMMKMNNANYSGGIFLRKNVTIYNEEGRSFARKSKQEYDLIDIPMLDAFNSAASGVYALNESYLYTIESFSDFYQRLSPRGILSVTRWITTPPRDSLKIFNMAVTFLKKINVSNVEGRIIAVRSLQTVTILISKTPFTGDDITRVKRFCNGRLFEILYYPGIKQGETEYFIRERGTPLGELFAELLSSKSENFIESFESDISAPEDNRPYFYNFFKPAFLKYIIKFGPGQIPVTEWGYLLLIIILIPVTVISFISILLPVFKLGKRGEVQSGWIIPYFSLIAAGFFFIEMPLIQKMILFLGSPVLSLSVIISSLLFFSGIGSFFSDRIFNTEGGVMKTVIIICGIILLYSFFLDKLFSFCIHYQLHLKIMLVVIFIAPPAFFMGMPFPKGLSLLEDRDGSSLPIAWGVNGFFSVISIITAAIFAIIYGYRFVLLIAVICYITAGIISLKLVLRRGPWDEAKQK